MNQTLKNWETNHSMFVILTDIAREYYILHNGEIKEIDFHWFNKPPFCLGCPWKPLRYIKKAITILHTTASTSDKRRNPTEQISDDKTSKCFPSQLFNEMSTFKILTVSILLIALPVQKLPEWIMNN